MERKIINYKLPYIEKGKQKTKELKISFVSNRVSREYSEIMGVVYEVARKWTRLNEINGDIENNILTAPKEKILDRIKELKNEAAKLTDEIKQYNDNVFFEKRFNLINRILQDNGISETKLNTIEFWDESVEPDKIMDFIKTVVTKDYPETNEKGVKKK